MALRTTICALLMASQLTEAHIALWHKAMYGLNWPHQITDPMNSWNNNRPVVPLRQSAKLETLEWFGHEELKDFPPAEGELMELESGGVFAGELSCNRAYTSLRSPALSHIPLPYYACTTVGPLHVNLTFGDKPDDSKFGGTALAIAYTSDLASLHPSDMTVISINYTSVWARETLYPIPSGLPPCPKGGCLCTWNWLHQSEHGEGYGREMYNNIYRCTVTGKTDSKAVLPLGVGRPPVYCRDEPESCVKGPKQPLYVYQASGNNVDDRHGTPTYNQRFGFRDGAQVDVFEPSSSTEPMPTGSQQPIGPETDPAKSVEEEMDPSLEIAEEAGQDIGHWLVDKSAQVVQSIPGNLASVFRKRPDDSREEDSTGIQAVMQAPPAGAVIES